MVRFGCEILVAEDAINPLKLGTKERVARIVTTDRRT